MNGCEKSSSPEPSSAYAFTRAYMCTRSRGAADGEGFSIFHATRVPFAVSFTGPSAVITTIRAGRSVSASTIVPSNEIRVNFNSSNPCLHVGGNYNQNLNHGLFYVNYNGTSNSNANIGCPTLPIV